MEVLVQNTIYKRRDVWMKKENNKTEQQAQDVELLKSSVIEQNNEDGSRIEIGTIQLQGIIVKITPIDESHNQFEVFPQDLMRITRKLSLPVDVDMDKEAILEKLKIIKVNSEICSDTTTYKIGTNLHIFGM